MIYRDFKGEKLSLLGFGAMRLPLLEDKSIDVPQVSKMVDMAMNAGVNYYDTAYPYHGGMSEIVICKELSRYPRESYKIATKYPGHQIADEYNPKEIFEEQLKKCGVDYFDFYLLHNVYEKSIEVYIDEKWGIVPYFLEQKRLGRIKHLGFSSHGAPENLEEFLEYCNGEMEFCQIQLNYLDWTLQKAKEKCEVLKRYNVPIWVMEPVRGGKLAILPENCEKELKEIEPDMSVASWAFRWLQQFDEVKVVLSGMSNIEQMSDNINTFSTPKLLSKKENELILEIAEEIKNAIPCTGCRYCCDSCPKELDIPDLISKYNEVKFNPAGAMTVAMRVEAIAENKLPNACVSCRRCVKVCPQNIDIPQVMMEFDKLLEKLPKWSEICRIRNEEAKKLKEQK